MKKKKQGLQPPQYQRTQPGIEEKMHPKPEYYDPKYKGSGKLKGKVALLTGGDSGIGRAIAHVFALEGADLIIHYLNEDKDAIKTKEIVEDLGARTLLVSANLQTFAQCEKVVRKGLKEFGKIDILINNIAEQHPQKKFEDISCEQLERTFKTNCFSYFYMIRAILPHFKKGSVIINTTSITAYEGNDHLIDYSATKGAIVALTRSLSKHLVQRKIRVNAVAPGPVWTPLIPASFSPKHVKEFGGQVPMKRAGQPFEIAPSYVFLASDDSSYMTGQVLHPNGGVIVSS